MSKEEKGRRYSAGRRFSVCLASGFSGNYIEGRNEATGERVTLWAGRMLEASEASNTTPSMDAFLTECADREWER